MSLLVFLKIFFIALLISPNESSKASFQTENSIDIQITRLHSPNPSPINPEHVISRAIADVIREFYIANDIKFDFIIYGETSSHINDIVNEVTNKVSKDNFPVTLNHIRDARGWNHEMSQSAVIFVKSEQNFVNLHRSSTNGIKLITKLTNFEPKPFKFLVYVEEINSLNQLNYSVSKNNYYYAGVPADLRSFEFFITSDGFMVELTARVLFSEKHCGAFALKVLNSFDAKSQQWKQKLENFNHFSNFHGCLLEFSTKIHNFFYIKNQLNVYEQRSQSHLTNEKTEFGGLITEVLDLLAQKNNFSFHFTIIDMNNGALIISSTKNYETSFLQIIGLDNTFLDKSILNGHFTVAFSSHDWFYLVSMNDLYTNYEKLLFPFDAATWTLLLFTFVLTGGTIFGLRFCPQWIRTMILGRGKCEN
jgi:hypothetical protein